MKTLLVALCPGPCVCGRAILVADVVSGPEKGGRAGPQVLMHRPGTWTRTSITWPNARGADDYVLCRRTMGSPMAKFLKGLDMLCPRRARMRPWLPSG